MEIECGPCAEFSIYHLMDLEPGEERFPRAEPEVATSNSEPVPRMRISYSVSIIGRGTGSTNNSATAASSALGTTERMISKPSEQPSPIQDTRPTPETLDTNTDHHRKIPTVLGDIARVRSKNAGPFEITYDAMFDSDAVYHLVKRSGVLSTRAVCEAIGLEKESDVVWSGFFDPARAYKITAPRLRDGRRVPSGSFMETDVHASQKYIGLLNLPLPTDLVERLVNSTQW